MSAINCIPVDIPAANSAISIEDSSPLGLEEAIRLAAQIGRT